MYWNADLATERSVPVVTTKREGDMETLVIGHLRPDLDSIASAVAYAALLHQRGVAAEAGRSGPLDEQSSWALKRFGIAAPKPVLDVAPTFAAIARREPAQKPSISLAEVMTAIARGARAVVVVDPEGKPVALLDPRACVHLLGQALVSGSAADRERAIGAIVERSREPAIPAAGMPAGLEAPLVFAGDERVSDRRKTIIGVDADDYLVVDGGGRYLGIASRSDALAPPRRPLVLVDHNELSQAVPGTEEAEIVEVLDHHRLGNPATAIPIPFVVDPVGSTATLVTEAWRSEDEPPSPGLAGLLLAAILSDTMAFLSPTTTPRDRVAANWLAALCDITDVHQFGVEVVTAGAGLAQRSGAEIVGEDFKEYEVAAGKLLVSQAEVRNLHEISPRVADLRAALESLRERRGSSLALLLLTDPVRGVSRLLARGEPRLIAQLPYHSAPDGLFDAGPVVSRKKQLIPALLAALES